MKGCRPPALRSIAEANCRDPAVVAIEQRHHRSARRRPARRLPDTLWKKSRISSGAAVAQKRYRRVMTQKRMPRMLAKRLAQDYQRIVVAVGPVVHRGKLDGDFGSRVRRPWPARSCRSPPWTWWGSGRPTARWLPATAASATDSVARLPNRACSRAAHDRIACPTHPNLTAHAERGDYADGHKQLPPTPWTGNDFFREMLVRQGLNFPASTATVLARC